VASSLGELLQRAVDSGAKLGARVCEAGVERVAVDADGLYPLASVRKVVTLGGYALAVASGGLDPCEPVPARRITRWYWPGTDGGAHDRTREWWTVTGQLQRRASEDVVPLQAVAQAMISFSDNASADYLLDRVGPERAQSFAQRMGLCTQDPILPVLGEFRAWHRLPDRWLAMSPGERAAEAWCLAHGERVPQDDVPIDDPTQRRCAEAGCRGTPREWCDLMSRLARGSDLPEDAHEVVLSVLEHRNGLRGAADGRLGRKAGDLPGVLAFAGYVRDRGGGAADVAVALFLRDLTGELLPRLAEALPQSPAHLLELRSALPVHR
jgi:hypothetical protein